MRERRPHAPRFVKPGEVREKIGQWLSCGSRAVWLIDPDRREVTVHRPLARPRVLKGDDVLEGEDALPGFRIQVSKLFE